MAVGDILIIIIYIYNDIIVKCEGPAEYVDDIFLSQAYELHIPILKTRVSCLYSIIQHDCIRKRLGNVKRAVHSVPLKTIIILYSVYCTYACC